MSIVHDSDHTNRQNYSTSTKFWKPSLERKIYRSISSWMAMLPSYMVSWSMIRFSIFNNCGVDLRINCVDTEGVARRFSTDRYAPLDKSRNFWPVIEKSCRSPSCFRPGERVDSSPSNFANPRDIIFSIDQYQVGSPCDLLLWSTGARCVFQ